MDRSSKVVGEVRVSGSESVNVLVSPNLRDAEAAISEGILHKKAVLIAGRCRVQYVGRAKSDLELGERILIIKADGSLLVHRSTGYEPVNWMPGGDAFYNVQTKEQKLQVRAQRKKPAETVNVVFDGIQLVASLVLSDAGEFSLYASEEDMQKAILLKPALLEEGFKPVTYEKKVAPGFVDVYGEDKDGKFVVVEIKRRTAGKEAAMQLARYVEAIRGRTSREVRGILVAPSTGKDVLRTLATLGLEYKHLDPKRCAETFTRVRMKRLADFV
jgi:RecB family endonuclease NucS